jgi:hypothetical protein
MSVATTAPAALKVLWKDEVFLAPKSVGSIHTELAKRGYNFGDKNLMMALRASKFLTRKGPKGSYTYVQKHPYVEESTHGTKRPRRKGSRRS